MSDFDTYTDRYERHRQAAGKASELNKATLFSVLASAGITEIEVTFDGCGDSGQIEDITVRIGETPKTLPAPSAAVPPLATQAVPITPLPETPITLYRAQWDSDEIDLYKTTLQDAIETLCYDYLEAEHGAWGDNDGAYGEFRFDVAARAIHLEFNERFTEVSTSHHTF